LDFRSYYFRKKKWFWKYFFVCSVMSGISYLSNRSILFCQTL